MSKRFLVLAGLTLWMASSAVTADDKDLLKPGTAPPNVLIVFGNSQTTEQPILGSTSAWDGDADSPRSKMGAAKKVVKQFVTDKHTSFNIGLTTFSHNPNNKSITISGKHWLYSPIGTAAGGSGAVDFPSETWQEPIGTIERWGVKGEGPCTNVTVPACADPSLNLINLTSGVAGPIGPFFGSKGNGTAFIYLDGTVDNKGVPKNATKRIQLTLTAGNYGDAFADGSLSTYAIPTPSPAHSMAVTKAYQTFASNKWTTQSFTLGGDPGTVIVYYVPPTTLTSDQFFTTTTVSGDEPGKEIGFLNDPQGDIDVNANCAGWEFQSNSSPVPLVKIPRDYKWGQACDPPQDSLPCVARLLRPQARLVSYNQTSGAFTTTDPDNPGYAGSGSKYADGCDTNLLGAADPKIGLDVTENQAIMITRNGSQAPVKDLLKNILEYFTKASIDNFQNGKRLDDPNKACRTSSVILIYDNFNGCQNDTCSVLTSQVLTPLKQAGVRVFVIGFGASATDTSSTGVCIAQNTGATVKTPTGTQPAYFPVTDPAGLYSVLNEIASIIDEAPKTFAASSVSTAQLLGDQMAYFASFNAAKDRSIWDGRINGYRLDANGNVQLGPFTINDAADPNNGVTVQVPSNSSNSLIWNAGENLFVTPGTGATNPSAVLQPAATLSSGTYLDTSNDISNPNVPTHFYPGRKIVFSLPQGYTSPVTTLPVAATDAVPETRHDMTKATGATWWPDLKALLGPQTVPPAALSPALADDDAGNALRFIWGDRDAVTGSTEPGQQYLGVKLGDIFHSAPLLVGRPNDFALNKTNVQNYQAFLNTYGTRRRVLYLGANDGLFHGLDAGVWDRDRSVCAKEPDGSDGHCYDLGTGAELFAFAPRAIMQIYKPLKDAVGPQTKRDEWTVDGSPTAGDVFMDAGHSGTPDASHRAWHTVLVDGMREGSPFEGTSGASPQQSLGSYFALDITQPDELVVNGSGVVGPPSSPYTFKAPKCLNASFDASCGHDAADATVRGTQPARDWPTVLWEISDAGDQDVSGSPGFGYADMGETWSKASMGRVKTCVSSCGTATPVKEDHYVAIFAGGFDRERLNRRGNWLYMVDVETGKTLYRANSSCGVNAGSGGCTPTYFGSIVSEPSALDFNGDGVLDMIYIGDLKGQVWRIDLSDLRKLSSPPGGRFNNQLDLAAGSGKPFLFFQAPQPTSGTTPFYPIYYRPTAVALGYKVGNVPALGIAFGTGDRDDILAKVDVSSITYNQRFYYVVDVGNTATRTESDLTDISAPNAAVVSTAPTNGWTLELCTPDTAKGTCQSGERVISDSLASAGVIFFSTFNPATTTSSTDACANVAKCSAIGGTARLYRVDYATGNPYLSGCATPPCDRGETQANATFLSPPVFFISKDQGGQILYTTDNYVKKEGAPSGRKITIKSWKENNRRP